VPPNSTGCRLVLDRGVDGVWPGTNADEIMTIIFEYLYAGAWSEVARVSPHGGAYPARFGGGLRLQEHVEVTWPGHSENGVLVLDVPDAGRATITVNQAVLTGGTFQWL
jgi:hypothetical protein